jgi:4'-phosphopantetheinyl transferase
MNSKLPDNAVHVFHADIGENGPVDLDLCWQIIGDAERTRAERFRYDLHRERYVKAHGRLRQILAGYLELPHDQVRIELQKGGKPFIPESNLQFNMSHSKDSAVYAVTATGHIGIDVELFDRRVEIDDLSSHYYTPSEQAVLAGLDPTARREMFFWLWTAKEARMKLTGEGLALDPRNIDVVIERGIPSGYKAPIKPPATLAVVDVPGLKGACSVAGHSVMSVEVRELSDIRG